MKNSYKIITMIGRKKSKSNIWKRIIAGLIDYIIIYSITILFCYTLGEPDAEGTFELNGFLALVPILFWFIMTVGLELTFSRTLGNWLVKLKAIPASGVYRKLTFSESLKRHLLDPIDMSCIGLVGIIAIKNTDKKTKVRRPVG